MQIKFNNVTADYQLGPLRTPGVLQSVNFSLKPGSFTAVIGHTGAGKSSLLKTMNGLLLPTKGHIQIGKNMITAENNKQSLKEIRKQVGMVFQFPESQLFAETVEQDICFGPLNFGVSLEEAKKIAKDVLLQIGLDTDILPKSPFSLSGGQKRRVAIAGVLATQPKVLILDEPGAGLDPEGKREILSLISSLHREQSVTIVLVTHDMDDVALYAEDVIVMEQGQVVMHDQVRNVFSDQEWLSSLHLDVPEARHFQSKIEQQSGIKLPQVCLTIDELKKGLIEVGLI